MTRDNKIQSPCPICSKPVIWQPESTWRPFCSQRCRLIDLGEWLDDSRSIQEAADVDLLPPSVNS